MPQSVYFFGNGKADGTRDMKAILGGKGANLAEMVNLGVPVPPGFTIACDQCIAYLKEQTYSDELREEVAQNLRRLEEATNRRFGDPQRPLLVSVRSGGPVSMPGMMETILNLGLNDRTVLALAQESGNVRFAYDSYRRFLQMYGDVVLNVPASAFEHLLSAKRMTAGVRHDSELDEHALRNLVEEYKALVRNRTGGDFPMDPLNQLWGAIEAVWKSWMLKKAVDYRRVNGISETLGTAVNIVAMVFGNMGDDSGTGVAFTRDPSTGERRFYGEFLVNAQGEDVVAGIRTPLDIEEMAQRLPAPYVELLKVQDLLERHFREMQDLEFTVERGTLYLLQTRTGKRTAAAAIRIAPDHGGGSHPGHLTLRSCESCRRSSTSCCIRSSIRAHEQFRSRGWAPGIAGRSKRHRGVRSRRRRTTWRARRGGDPRSGRNNARGLSRHGCGVPC
ncbi:MAG: PEP/pyruvate-binding domain-containing protein [Gemmatimonadaceae bacterium]